MPKLAMYSKTGNQVGEVDLNDSVFAIKVNEPVVHRAVVAQLNAKRAGTSKVKTRGEIIGSKQKPWRQKGTGRARQGSEKAPHWVGGGVAFGPSPRSFAQKINKKEKRLAVKSALSYKVQEGKLIVIDDFSITEPKTRDMVKILTDLNLQDKKVLIILPGKDEVLYKSARNIPNVKTLVMQALNIYDLVNYDYLLTTKDAVTAIGEVLV